MATTTVAQSKTAEIVDWAHDFLGLTWDDVGSVVGTSGRTVQRWRGYDASPARETQPRLDELGELRFWLETVFKNDNRAAQEWLHTQLLDLRGKTPLQAIKVGQIGTIVEYLATFHTGAFI